MDLSFEQGNPQEPKGHALAYFNATGVEKPLATYVVVMPVKVDFAKYIPPMMASQIEELGVKEFHAFALPPIPEEIESLQYLQRLAETRGDDLVYGGNLSPSDIPTTVQRVNDLVQAYAQVYYEYIQSAVDESTLLSVNEILYGLMSTYDRLIALSTSTSKLRFATEGEDHRLAEEAKEEMRTLAHYLPGNYRIDSLLEAAQTPTGLGAELAQLYLERCYKLSDEDYINVMQLEERIQALKSTDGIAYDEMGESMEP